MATEIKLADGSILFGIATNGLPWAILKGKNWERVYTAADEEYETIMKNIIQADDLKGVALDDETKVMVFEGAVVHYVDPEGGGVHFVVTKGGSTQTVYQGTEEFDKLWRIMFIHNMYHNLPTTDSADPTLDLEHFDGAPQKIDLEEIVRKVRAGAGHMLNQQEKNAWYGLRQQHPTGMHSTPVEEYGPGITKKADPNPFAKFYDGLDSVYKPLSKRLRHQHDSVTEEE